MFDENYILRSLSDVETYIREHKHLPEMMPAKAMQSDGMPVAEVVTKQLAKIEELTLYAIQAQRERDAARREVADLQRRMERLEKALLEQ